MRTNKNAAEINSDAIFVIRINNVEAMGGALWVVCTYVCVCVVV